LTADNDFVLAAGHCPLRVWRPNRWMRPSSAHGPANRDLDRRFDTCTARLAPESLESACNPPRIKRSNAIFAAASRTTRSYRREGQSHSATRGDDQAKCGFGFVQFGERRRPWRLAADGREGSHAPPRSWTRCGRRSTKGWVAALPQLAIARRSSAKGARKEQPGLSRPRC